MDVKQGSYRKEKNQDKKLIVSYTITTAEKSKKKFQIYMIVTGKNEVEGITPKSRAQAEAQVINGVLNDTGILESINDKDRYGAILCKVIARSDTNEGKKIGIGKWFKSKVKKEKPKEEKPKKEKPKKTKTKKILKPAHNTVTKQALEKREWHCTAEKCGKIFDTKQEVLQHERHCHFYSDSLES